MSNRDPPTDPNPDRVVHLLHGILGEHGLTYDKQPDGTYKLVLVDGMQLVPPLPAGQPTRSQLVGMISELRVALGECLYRLAWEVDPPAGHDEDEYETRDFTDADMDENVRVYEVTAFEPMPGDLSPSGGVDCSWSIQRAIERSRGGTR